MNGKDLLKSMTEINLNYIQEADSSELKIIQKKHKNLITVSTVIAAAAAMTITAGAVSEVFLHRETVESYLFGSSRKQLEEMGLVSNYVTENEHFRMTTETILNDGFNLYFIATLEPLDEMAQDFLQKNGAFTMDSDFYDTSTGEMMRYHGSAGFRTENGKNLLEFQYGFDMADVSRSAEIVFSVPERHYPNQAYLTEGLSIPVTLVPNLQTVEFQSESGESVWLSPFELYSKTQNCLTTPNDKIYLVKTNGFRTEIDDDFEQSGLSSKGGASALHGEETDMNYSYLQFDKIINIEEYQAIEFKNIFTGTSIIYQK